MLAFPNLASLSFCSLFCISKFDVLPSWLLQHHTSESNELLRLHWREQTYHNAGFQSWQQQQCYVNDRFYSIDSTLVFHFSAFDWFWHQTCLEQNWGYKTNIHSCLDNRHKTMTLASCNKSLATSSKNYLIHIRRMIHQYHFATGHFKWYNSQWCTFQPDQPPWDSP